MLNAVYIYVIRFSFTDASDIARALIFANIKFSYEQTGCFIIDKKDHKKALATLLRQATTTNFRISEYRP